MAPRHSHTTHVHIGRSDAAQRLALKFANRHGLIAGATGTGKTVTLQILAEGFSTAGVPVFCADVKGDLAGLSRAIEPNAKLTARAEKTGPEGYAPAAFPVRFWDLFGEQGHPVRATVTEMGPVLLARLLGLNDVQEGVLTLCFRLADDEGLLLLDLKDLRAMLVEVGQRTKELSLEYGHVSRASIGAIQRRLLAFEEEGGEAFFGEPALELEDFLDTDETGAGVVNVLAADRLMRAPKTYAVFLLWLLSELFERLPEVGDPDRPRLVFFFDEAHLLFDRAPRALVDKVEQVVKLIRSKGVGVYFVTQNPLDVPDDVSSQLGNRIIHALRAFTPKEKRVVKAAAETFRQNPGFDSEEIITVLKVGEALVSTLNEDGAPGIVQRTLIRPPSSRMGPVTAAERRETIAGSEMDEIYGAAVDRVSAYEILRERAEALAAQEADAPPPKRRSRGRRRQSNRQSVSEAAIKSAARTISTTLARELMRGLFGGLKRRRRR
ncbi:MAG: helicase HerA-like domain-containing protein [Pseudomonadota bacterium]